MSEVLKTVQSYLERWMGLDDPTKYRQKQPIGLTPEAVPPFKTEQDRKVFKDQNVFDSTGYYKEKVKGTPTTIDEMAIAEFKGLQGYRANPKNKWGATDGLETQPTAFDIGDIADLLSNTRAMRQEKDRIPQLTPQQIAAFVLKEGRGNSHANGIDWDNKDSVALFHSLSEKYSEDTARYLTMVKEKTDLAKRLNKPFAELWNGTGRNYQGSSGSDYAKGYENFVKAADHPKNKAFLDFITNASNTAGKK